jgi:hypothetical protein
MGGEVRVELLAVEDGARTWAGHVVDIYAMAAGSELEFERGDGEENLQLMLGCAGREMVRVDCTWVNEQGRNLCT